jgi:hypothetical protein
MTRAKAFSILFPLMALFLISMTAQDGGAKTKGAAGKSLSEKNIVDWNGDGKYDLLLGDKEGFVIVYTNDGSNASPQFGNRMRLRAGGQEIKVKGPSTPCLVDWNEDGKKDLLVGDDGGYLFVFINAGTNKEPEYASMAKVQANYKDLDVGGKASACVVDWNADGRLDLLIGCGGGVLYLYLNEGTKGQPIFGPPIKINDGKLDVGSESAPDMADLNGDGKKDLIVGNDDGEIFIFINQGRDEDPQFDNAGAKILLRFNEEAAPRLIDWNRSGLMDLVVVDKYGEVTLCPNKGKGKSPAFTEKRILMRGKRD